MHAGHDLTAGGEPTRSASRGFFGERGLPLGLQLFTLGDAFQKEPERTLARVAEIGYRTVELPGLMAGDAKRVRAAADHAGLRVTSVHVPVQQPSVAGSALSLAADVSLVASELAVLGASSAVVSMAPMPAVKPADGESMMDALARGFRADGGAHWREFAALLSKRGARLKDEGIALSYHNHNFEFSPFEGTSGWDILVENTDPRLVHFELDVAWVAAAGLDPVSTIRWHAGRIRQLHLKDITPATQPNFRMSMESTEVGGGRLDWKQILPEAYRAGVREFYVEQEPPFQRDRFEAIAKSYAYLTGKV